MQTENTHRNQDVADNAVEESRRANAESQTQPTAQFVCVNFCRRCGYPHAEQFCPRCGHRQCIACGDG